MDNEMVADYLEEQRGILIGVSNGIQGVLDAIKALPAPVEQVSATVDNDVLSVKVLNDTYKIDVADKQQLSELVDGLKLALTNTITESKPTELRVSNLDEIKMPQQIAPPTTLKVSNLNKLESLLTTIAQKNLEVTVQREVLKLPTSAKEAIPVRLSDGKSFYDVKNMGGGSGTMGGMTTGDDPTRGYMPSDKDEASTTKYYGFMNKEGYWYIMQDTTTTDRYIKGTSGYATAWTNRASLTYGYFSEVWK
jgi:hypothetical protein